MRGLLATVVVLAIVAIPALGAWSEPADYVGSAFINFGDYTGGAAVTGGVSQRFTARTSDTVQKIRLTLDSFTSLVGPPSATLGIYADSGGIPGAALGVSPVFTLPDGTGNTWFEVTMGSNVTFVPGNVYHVTLLYAGNAGSADNSRVRIGMQKADYDQRIWDKAIDPMLAGLFYLQGDAIFPDGWYEGKRAEFTKVWEPLFGLYDESGNGSSEGEGSDKRYNDRNWYSSPYTGNSFILRDPAVQCVDKIRVYVANKSTPGDLVVKLLDASDNVLTSGTLTDAQHTGTNWYEIPVAPVGVGQGKRYKLVMEGTGDSSYANHWEPYRCDYGTVVPIEASWRGLEAYGVSSADSGATYPTADQTVEWAIQVPEPATLGLLVLGGLAVLARKRR
jgi:hypothetical protein